MDGQNSQYRMTTTDSDEGTNEKKVRYGFCYVDGCPVSPEATQALLERITFVRITHYGGFYDFTSDLRMKDTAYTSEALGAHTDTAYFTDPVGYQMFHLLSHEDGSGGASLLVDGHRAAQILADVHPRAHEVLCKKLLRWHSSGNEGVSVINEIAKPVLEKKSHSRIVDTIRWNNYDRKTLDEGFEASEDGITVRDWYDAARIFNALVTSPELEYWEQLVPGRALRRYFNVIVLVVC